jgi:DNA invertase Pin-like site-specific DNA recombinase
MIIGYARVSTQDQNPQLQLDALTTAGCEEVFHEKATGVVRERPELTACLRTLRKGDTLVVWKLDRLARSLKDLVQIVHDLDSRHVGFKSLTESIDTTSSGGRLVFHIFGALAEFEHTLIRELTTADVRKAAAMLSDPNITKTEVARHFGVTRATLNAAFERAGIQDPLLAGNKPEQA